MVRISRLTVNTLNCMNPQTLFAQSAPTHSIRSLKIEAEGDFWKGRIKPKIRLVGRWLERAGFEAGRRVHVTCVAPGVIELRSHDAYRPCEMRLASPEKLE